ncbi:MAG: DUF433 domain-containing protein [Chloroflexia bacterium]
MVTTIASDPVPLRVDDTGTIRVGNTRVVLDLVIKAYLDGESAEGIAEMFDTLDLGDVYSVLGYYIHHKGEIDAHMLERARQAEEIRAKIEARHGSQAGLREKLLARLAKKNAEATG